MKQSVLKGNELYIKQEYKKEEELENIFGKYYQLIISNKSYWIPLKKQLKSKKFKNFKHSIGDGFLLVWDNPTTPTLYITEVELEKHDINKHILPQLGTLTPHHLGNKFRPSLSSSSLTFLGTSDMISFSPILTM